MKKTVIAIAATAVISIAATAALTPVILNIWQDSYYTPVSAEVLSQTAAAQSTAAGTTAAPYNESAESLSQLESETSATASPRPLSATSIETAQPENSIEVTTQFYIPPLDLRGYDLNHFEMQQWFIDRINDYRVNYGLHPYEFYTPAIVTSIEHSLDMRDNNFGRNTASDGRTHQERHNRWIGAQRTRVTSAHSSSHTVEGPLTEAGAIEIVDRIMDVESTESFLMNPTYYYIGIGFSIQDNDRGRLSITMVGQPGLRAAHRARTPEEREIHREEYLEMVRARNGWIAP